MTRASKGLMTGIALALGAGVVAQVSGACDSQGTSSSSATGGHGGATVSSSDNTTTGAGGKDAGKDADVKDGKSDGASSGTGVVCMPGDFWPCTNDAKCAAVKPSPPDHDAYGLSDCLTCHGPGGDAGPSKEFLFGGVVWNPYHPEKGQPHMEVGLRDGAAFFYTCTDDRGFFFYPAAGATPPNWATTENRVRSFLGEKTMPADKEHRASCNASDCHGSTIHKIPAPI